MEGDSGIVARTYGTSVLLERTNTLAASTRSLGVTSSFPRRNKGSITETPSADKGLANEGVNSSSSLRASLRRVDIIEDSPVPSETNRSPKSPKTTTSVSAALHNPVWWREAVEAAIRYRDSHEEGDIQLLTMRDFDPTVRVRLGGLVTARSVKYLGNIASKMSDQETRDSWWNELREEIKAHAKILGCSHVIGYLEASTIHDDVAILSITGTAATVRGLPDILWAARFESNWPSRDKSDGRRKSDEIVDEPSVAQGEVSDAVTEPRTHRRKRRPNEKDGTDDFDEANSPPQWRDNRKFFPTRRAKPCSGK